MPAQPLLGTTSLVDEIVAVVDQQLQLAQRGLLGPRRVEQRLPSAALAMASASIRSDLPRTRPRRRSGAVSRGGTRTSRCRCRCSVRSRPRVTCRQSSSAHKRRRPTRFDQETSSSPSLVSKHRAADPPRQQQQQRTSACARPPRSRSSAVASYRWGRPASGQASIEASCQAPIRSRSTVSGRRRRHNTGKSAHGRRSGIESAAANPSLFPPPDGTTAITMTLSSGMTPEGTDASRRDLVRPARRRDGVTDGRLCWWACRLAARRRCSRCVERGGPRSRPILPVLRSHFRKPV